jgi:hypothetical protein
MPFRREQVEALCRLTDEYNARHPVTDDQREQIRRKVDRIVEANNLLHANGGVEGLSDDMVTALIVLLASHGESGPGCADE